MNGAPSCAEVEFHSAIGGSNIITGGTAFGKDSYSGSYLPANCVDGNTSTIWAANTKPPNWWGYDFGVGNTVNVVEIKWTARGDCCPEQNPTFFNMQYSDDDVTYTTAWSQNSFSASATIWAQGQVRTMTKPQAPAALSGTWTGKRKVTVKHLAGLSADISNYPFLICANSTGANNCANTGSDLAVTGSGGSVQSSSGYDIVVASDAACTTLIDFETDKWVSTSGEWWGWAKTTLPKTTDAAVYLCYGNTAITTKRANPYSLWSGYATVNHLNLIPTTQYWPDSTVSGNTLGSGGSSDATSTTGMIGAASSSPGLGGSQNDSGSAANLPSGGDPRTFSFWAKLGQTTADIAFAGWGISNAFQMYRTQAAEHNYFLFFGGGSDTYTAASDTNWHYLVMTSSTNNANSAVLYVDGSAVSWSSQSAGTFSTDNQVFCTNHQCNVNNYTYKGLLDEIRVIPSVPANIADLVLADYTCQWNPSTCMAIGGNLALSHPKSNISGWH